MSFTDSTDSLPITRTFSQTLVEYEWRDVVVDFATGQRLSCHVPKAWSDNAAATLMSKYAVRSGVPDWAGGRGGREVDARLIFDRLVAGWRAAAIEHGYWSADDPNLDAFCDEIHAMLEQQIAAPNSPQWFNTGVQVQYGIKAGSDGHYFATVDVQGEAHAQLCTDSLAHPQISACFIQSVDDKLVGDGGIMDLWQREARLFKYGSGSGANYSALRGKGEALSRGGASSGLLSFLRVGDRSAGAIKSGGTTRRSARMVVVDVDHPDVEDFIAWKPREDAKIRALHAAGFGDPSSFEDEATETVSGQNANNSVAVTDDFMDAVQRGDTWALTNRVDGSTAKKVDARGLWQQIAEAAWACADPGLQFVDTINRWHTCKADGPIRASNPCCLVRGTLVWTEHGYETIGALAAAHARGEPLPRVWAWDNGAPTLRLCVRAWKSGDAESLCVVTTKNGTTVTCTPEHRVMLIDGEYIEAQHSRGYQLANADEVDWISFKHYCEGAGSEPVYDIEVEGVHNFMVTDHPDNDPVVVHNSEYVFLDDTACNLASINLAKLCYTDGFDWSRYVHAVRLWTIVLDISVSMAGYPTAEIARRSMLYRTLGLGYAALGEALVLLGLGYGTEPGRRFAALVTEALTLQAYETSVDLARKLGPFPRFAVNKEHVLEVLGRHARVDGAVNAWEDVRRQAAIFGVRNAQVSLLAPCGTIGIVMDCETTGVEPYYSDTTFKKLAGGGVMRLASARFAECLTERGHDPEDYTRRAWTVEQGEVREYVWVEPPADLADVLVCADDLTPQQHVDMMAAVQPFLSGAISKTVNMPAETTVEQVGEMYVYAWRRGLKSIAIYRDGCKPAQPLQGRRPAAGVQTFDSREAAEALAVAAVHSATAVGFADGTAHRSSPSARGERVEPPESARAHKYRVDLSGHTFYLFLTEREDGSLAEVFVTCSRTGSAISGWVNSWAKQFSIALQYGAPVAELVSAMRGETFEPAGYHDGRPVLSPVDCFARIIEARYLSSDEPSSSQDATIIEVSLTSPWSVEDVAAAHERLTSKPTGQICANCGSSDLRRSGACFVCGACGSTTGCS